MLGEMYAANIITAVTTHSVVHEAPHSSETGEGLQNTHL